VPCRERAHRAILRAPGGAGVCRRASALNVPAIVGLNVAPDLETDVGAWNVIEAFAVQRADLHVLDGLGFHWQIGCLRAADYRQSCGRAKKHALLSHGVSPKCVSRRAEMALSRFLQLLLAISISVVRACTLRLTHFPHRQFVTVICTEQIK